MYGRPFGIWARTLLTIALYAVSIESVHRVLLAFTALDHSLSLALAFAIVQSAVIAAILAALLTRRGLALRRAVRGAPIRLAADEAVALHAAGQDRFRELRALQQRSRADVAAAVASFLAHTRGSMKQRVETLAHELSVDMTGEVDGTTIERAASGTLFDRVMAAEAMRARAPELAVAELPRALAREAPVAIAALDLLRAWRRTLDVGPMDRLLGHPDPEVRWRAFSVLPYVGQTDPDLLRAGLGDAEPRVRTAAAAAAGKMRAGVVAADLERMLQDASPEVASAAAFALASISGGMDILRRHAADHGVFEVIEKASLGRVETA